MRKSTKGALAGVAAVALLMGGFGTRAAWNDSGTFDGGSINDGSLALTGSGCLDWKLIDTDGTTVLATASDPSTLFLLPGQILTRHCSFSVSLKGVGTVTATINEPSFTLPGGLTGAGLELTTLLKKNTTTLTPDSSGVSTTVTDGDTISADFTASLDAAAVQSVWQNIAGSLNTLTVTVSM